ncbi:complex I NDUFA9 subunit family protein, partial [Candidatus Pelagibacter sp.]|nr:complex I NDUFA9 subunit family protein [Candidatus Pelagibacter sp.]
MKAKNCLIFGGSGQIGRHLIRKLTKNNYKVTVVTRNLHQKGYVIKTQANAGYIDIVEANIFDEQKIRKLFSKTDICINLIGILYESGKANTFKNIHSIFPSILAKLCKEYKIKNFIHLSALGINEAKDSEYAKSKLEGEALIQKNFPLATILRPSVVFSVDDNFTTNFMTLLSRLPIFPLYYGGDTKFT